VRLYHGTLDIHAASVLRGVQISLGRSNTDFGRGFYTTTVERQALAWAWQLAQRRPGTQPAVICFDVDRDALAGLESIWFVRGSFDADEYWSLVFHGRGGAIDHGRPGPDKWYDVVIGPVAANWWQRQTIHDADQVSFHSAKGAALLSRSGPRRLR